MHDDDLTALRQPSEFTAIQSDGLFYGTAKFTPKIAAACENAGGAKIDRIERELILEGDLNDEQKTRLLEIADKCPVHKTLHSPIEIITRLKEAAE